MVVITAGREQSFKKSCGANDYNYFGLGRPNGAGCTVHPISSLEQAIKELAESYESFTTGWKAKTIMNRFQERLAAGCEAGGYGPPGTYIGTQMLYSWIGDYRANPGDSGSGGCYYLKVMYGEDYPFCAPSNTCASVNGGPGCYKTTICEQSDYTKYQAKVTMQFWNEIFGG